MITVTLVFKLFKSEQVEVHFYFVEQVNLELNLVVFNFFANFQLHWDFRDAWSLKFLCFFRTNLRILQTAAENAITSKQLKVET